MSTILRIAAAPRGRRVQIVTDDAGVVSLIAETVARAGLRAGQQLTAAQIEQIKADDAVQVCLDAALHYLKYRPRSESEVVQQLRRRRFGDETIEKAVARLRERGLLNDGAFAEFWTSNRQAFRPRARWMLKAELGRKGVSGESAESATAGLDDETSAYEAARKKARGMRGTNYEEFRKRVAAFLQRRGFSYEVIRRTVKRLWEESGEA